MAGRLPVLGRPWTAQRDRLALGWQTKAFRDVQTAYLQLQAIVATPRADRGDVVLFWPALVTIDRAAEAVGKTARVEKRELEQFRRPLAERLEETRTLVEQVRAAGPQGMSRLLDEEAFRENAASILFHIKELVTWIWPRSNALDQFPPELRARAAEAIAHQQRAAPRPSAIRPPRLPSRGASLPARRRPRGGVSGPQRRRGTGSGPRRGDDGASR